MKRYLPLLAIAALLSAGVLFWRTQNLAKESDIRPGTVDSAAPVEDPVVPPPPSSAGVPPIPSPSGVSPAFVNYLQSESKLLNDTKINVSAAEQAVAAQVASMGENEVRYARDLALGPQNPAAQRILSAYILGASGVKGRAACRELILMNHNSNRAQPDSLDEMKNVQEKSMSLMCIDALAEQAKSDPAAKADLQRLVSEIKDESLKKQIQQRIRELTP